MRAWNFSRTSRATTTTASKTRTARITLPRAPLSSALAKIGGGHDGHRPCNADSGDRHPPPAHAPMRATTTTMTTMMTTRRRGGIRHGQSWRMMPRRQWTSFPNVFVPGNSNALKLLGGSEKFYSYLWCVTSKNVFC